MEKQLLIIDNDSMELRRLREILAREGFNIMTATDMETALKIYTHVTISFILSDASIFKYLDRDKDAGELKK